MTDKPHILRLIQSHKSLELFDYSIAVEWATDLVLQGNDTTNVLMLASFSEPIDRIEISPYLTAVLNDFRLEELDHKNAVIAKTYFHLSDILNDRAIRKNLASIYDLYLDNEYEPALNNFALLYYAWDDLEEREVNYYYDGADLNNIEELLKNEATQWIDTYIHGKGEPETEQKPPATQDLSGRVKRSKQSSNVFRKLWSKLTGE